MTIPFTKYVLIRSGVVAASVVPQRELIGRVFTTNARVPIDAVLEFATLSQVQDYFGAASNEALRAAFYFSYIDPNAGIPSRISFGRFAPAAVTSQVFGAQSSTPLATFQGMTAGVMQVTAGSNTYDTAPLNLSAAVDLSGVAALVQTGLRAVVGAAELATCTLTYDAVGQQFNFAASPGVTVAVRFAVPPGSTPSTDIAAAMNLYESQDAIVSPGTAQQTPAGAFVTSQDISDNFGAFVFMPTLTLDEVIALAQANASYNVKFIYSQGVTQANAQAWSAALIGIPSVGLTLKPLTTEYPEMLPLAQLAATNYQNRNSVVNYMFRQAGGLTPSVTDGTTSDTLDSQRVNYYGQTQTAGQKLAFYQRGLLMGGATAPVDMNVHANEQWFKDRAGSILMSLLIGAARVPANDAGRSQVQGVLQQAIDDALFNGVISVGKLLNAQQRAFVTQQTADPLAYLQVQNIGYWVDVRIVEEVGPGGTTEYKAVYVLIYSKDDAIRKIEGTHQLI